LKVINDRYDVIKLLHKDSSFIEYLVSDKAKNKEIKRIRIFDTEMSNYDFIKQMEEQFVELKTIIHENLLSNYEFQAILTVNGNRVNRKQYFYTYEHYEDSEIVSYIELNKSEINSVITQLCKAIRYLHFRGVVYKYLNFDQLILIKKEGGIQLKLKDIASNFINDYYFKMDHERFSQFIAPEIVWGEETNEQVDIYSLGAMVYYLYYRIDFRTKSLQTLIGSGHNNEIQRMIMKATSQIRDERHENINRFISELSSLIWIEIDHDDVKFYDKINESTRLIGRDSLIKDVKRLLNLKSRKALNQHGIMVQGEIGSGKTRVLNEIYYISKFSRYNYIQMRPTDYSDMFYTTKALIRHISAQDDVSPMLIQKYGQELVCLVPELAVQWNIKDVKSIDIKNQYLRVLNRVFNFFIDYTNNKFFLFLIDDFDKISKVERTFFEMLFDYKAPSNYFVIATTSEEDATYRKYDEVIAHFKLSSLNLEETGQMVKALLGLNYIPYKLTHRLMLENQGKASVTKRLVKRLWYDNVIYFDDQKMIWNFDEVDDSFTFDYVDQKKEDFDSVINSIKKEHYEVLRKLSVLKGSFSMQTLINFADVEEEFGYYFIYEMEDKHILNKRISDVEYVFVFHTNEMRKAFYDTLSSEEIVEISRKAADLFENKFSHHGEVNEALIDYLVASENLPGAADYCMKFSKVYMDKSNIHKALDLMEQGLELYMKQGETTKVIDYSIQLIKLLIKAGRLERAIEKVEYTYTILPEVAIERLIDLKIENAHILYFKNDISVSEALAREAQEAARTILYLDGELRAGYIIARCLIGRGELEAHEKLTLECLELSKKHHLIYHNAVFENERGINSLYNNRFDDSIEAFTESLKLHKEIEDDENIVKAYNNFGVIYLDGYGDYIVARDYFRKAYTKANSKNYFMNLPVYLNNLGETYRIEGRYEMANKYFDEAYQMAENVGDKTMIILALLNLCHGKLLNEAYGKTHKLIARLEHEIGIVQKRDYDKLDFYLLHFEYFLTMNSIMKVNQWRYEFNADDVIDDYRKYRLKIIDLKLSYRKEHLAVPQMSEGTMKRVLPITEIEKLFEITENPAESKLLREFVLELLIDIIVERDYLQAEKLLQIDNALMKRYNTKLVRLKRDFIEACFSDYSIERTVSLLDQIKEQSDEFLWRVYYILGNEYYDKNNTYEALKYYLMALDVIADLTVNIPFEFKETYILHDDLKMALKNKINKIIRILLNFEGTRYGVIAEGRIDTVEDFFDLSQFNLLYNNSEFLNLVYKNYDLADSEKYESSIDLIKHLEKDEITNLKLILKYLQQLTIGERAFIYLLDENDNISEVIKTEAFTPDYDILKLINNFGNDIEGIHISKLNPHTNVQLLTEDQKAMICFPIYEASADHKNGEKRRDDIFSSKKRISGYVFLDTANVINRFNDYTFEQAKSFINLIYVFIDNYNLKKLSTIDKLTGVYLRKHIEQQFAVLMSISRQQNYSLSVIMLDIDKFKNVNDTYGHRKGDEILSVIGELLLKSVRNTDYVGRYGGEEFIIILPETDATSGYKVAEKIRLLVQESKLLGEEHPLTVSLGIATYPIDGANEEELIEKADQALYYSKNNGRNRSTSWDDNLIKEGHRYDRLTGILTGNISSDTRNMQAILDIINQLNHGHSQRDGIKNTFISLLDITEGDEIQFIKFDQKGSIQDLLYKKKGYDEIVDRQIIDQRLIEQFTGTNQSHYFIDWEEITDKDALAIDDAITPDWKSYIIMSFHSEDNCGLLAISVRIKVKEFDFSNFNFVESLRPVLEHILF